MLSNQKLIKIKYWFYKINVLYGYKSTYLENYGTQASS